MSRPVKIVILANPDTGDIQMQGPLANLPLCHALLSRAQGHLFAKAMEADPAPPRKVQTLDELGVRGDRRAG